MQLFKATLVDVLDGTPTKTLEYNIAASTGEWSADRAEELAAGAFSPPITFYLKSQVISINTVYMQTATLSVPAVPLQCYKLYLVNELEKTPTRTLEYNIIAENGETACETALDLAVTAFSPTDTFYIKTMSIVVTTAYRSNEP